MRMHENTWHTLQGIPTERMKMGVVKIPVGVVAKGEDGYSFSNFFRLFNSSGLFDITETLMGNTYHVPK